MTLADDLRTTLHQMGNAADEVAEAVRAKGVRGVRHAVRSLNPLVRYLQEVLQQDKLDLDVMTGETLRLNKSSIIPDAEEVVLPPAVRQFLDAFNGRSYPDLELPEKQS